MRVVLDTNVIIASFATRGLCNDVFEICILDTTIVISEFILSEVRDKLINKLHIPSIFVSSIINYLESQVEKVHPSYIERSICKDEDDLMIIGTAVSGKAQYIITGANDLLIIKKYQDIEFNKPRKSWSIMLGRTT